MGKYCDESSYRIFLAAGRKKSKTCRITLLSSQHFPACSLYYPAWRYSVRFNCQPLLLILIKKPKIAIGKAVADFNYYYLMGALLPQRKSVCSFLFCSSDSMSDILFPQRRGALFSASSSMPQESGASLLPHRRGEARAMRDGFSSSCSYVWPKVIMQQQVKAANSQTIPLLIVAFNE